MAKRIVTKIGDIFCVDLGDGLKSFFQYIGNDFEMLNSSTIRAFKGVYDQSVDVSVDDILNSGVSFYAHTILRFGIESGVFVKFGKSKDLGLDGLEQVYFGMPSILAINPGPGGIISTDPYQNWMVGKYNQVRRNIGALPEELRDQIEFDSVLTYSDIYNKMLYGYFRFSVPFYDVVKRVPWPWAESYVMLTDRLVRVSMYYHFHGSRAVREVVVDADGRVFCMSVDETTDGLYRLYDKDFGDINWRHDEFITADMFEAMWCKSDKVR